MTDPVPCPVPTCGKKPEVADAHDSYGVVIGEWVSCHGEDHRIDIWTIAAWNETFGEKVCVWRGSGLPYFDVFDVGCAKGITAEGEAPNYCPDCGGKVKLEESE